MFKFIQKYLRKKYKKQYDNWIKIQESIKDDSFLYLGKVLSVRQKSKRGTKAYIQWIDNLNTEDAIWIENHFPKKGDYILGSGSYGPGVHHNETVFYFQENTLIINSKVHKGYIKYFKYLEKQNDNT